MSKEANVFGISHIGIIVKPENFDRCVEMYSRVLGIEFPAPRRAEDFGTILTINWDVGVESVAPVDDKSIYAKMLREGGEGTCIIGLSVRDIHGAATHAEEAGAQGVWKDFELFRMAQLAPMFGATFLFHQGDHD